MLRFAALLTLVAAIGCCSAYHFELSNTLQAYLTSQGKAADGQTYHFPCDGVTAREMESLDWNRLRGHWYTTNFAMSTSHKFDTDKIQENLSKTINCVFDGYNVTNPKVPVFQQVVGLRTAISNTTVIPGWNVVDNGTALFRALDVTLPRAGDNGKWQLSIDLGNSTTVIVDILLVATDYTKTAMFYSCQDIPVFGTADTAREQTWGLQRRKPVNFNMVELAALKLVALSRGIVDTDRLYTFPTDGC